MIRVILAILTVLAGLARSDVAMATEIAKMEHADVIILGEAHDNPRHHQAQAAIVARLLPRALVFEMLTGDQAAMITVENRGNEHALRRALDWDATGWPDFSFYYPIFAAGRSATIFGAGLPRQAARAAFEIGVVDYFGPDAALFGLDQRLDDAEQADREAFQLEAHCNALPLDLLPKMVYLQRLRDATLAQSVLAAIDGVGGPVVVITGNGHARRDRGLAVNLEQARPGLRIHAVGLSEDGQINGVFDEVLDFPSVPRSDPCLAFR